MPRAVVIKHLSHPGVLTLSHSDGATGGHEESKTQRCTVGWTEGEESDVDQIYDRIFIVSRQEVAHQISKH